MVNSSVKDDSQHVYLCGLPSQIENDLSNYFKVLSTRYRVGISTLDTIMSTVHYPVPNFVFLSVQEARQLPDVISNMALLRCNQPALYRILVCSQELLTAHVLEEVAYDGLLSTGCSSQDLLECLIKTSGGRRYVHYPARRIAGSAFLPDTITRHERVILDLITKGLQNKQIAEQLCISPHTVKNHKSKLMSKLNLASTIDLYQFAAEQEKDFIPVMAN